MNYTFSAQEFYFNGQVSAHLMALLLSSTAGSLIINPFALKISIDWFSHCEMNFEYPLKIAPNDHST
jgi:hypothetical protein